MYHCCLTHQLEPYLQSPAVWIGVALLSILAVRAILIWTLR